MTDFGPKLLGFLCEHCAYTGANKAGFNRIQYPPNMRNIKVMCSGRVDPTFILDAFRKGIDGILVAGCHPGECHYERGNYKTMRRIALLKNMLQQLGIEPERLRLEWIAADEGDKFAAVVEEMVNEIKQLGPNPVKGGE